MSKKKADILKELNGLAAENPQRMIDAVLACPEFVEAVGLRHEFDRWPKPARVVFSWR